MHDWVFERGAGENGEVDYWVRNEKKLEIEVVTGDV
jgi:hypothetical protein